MRKNKIEYSGLRWVTICLTTFMLPFGTFVGYEFGAGHTKIAIIALVTQTFITLIQAHVWWLTLEKAGK